jgi:SSS family solute:Na+ symporter
MTTAAAVNLGIVIVYLLAMLAMGVWLTRYVKSGADYFLAGRSLNRWVICGSVMSTNVAAMYLVGPAGKAYEGGAVILLMAWTGNMLAAISAVTFLPRFRRLRITTITELLRERYGRSLSMSVAGMWIIFYAMFSGVTMLTCATIIQGSFGIPDWYRVAGLGPFELGRFELLPFETAIATIAVVVVFYCLFSGLLAVVYTDLLQSFLIILGAVILLPLALKYAGGVSILFDADKIAPAKWTMFRAAAGGAGQDDYTLILMLLVLGLPYWFTSQYMLQRSFAGRNVQEASKGLLWAALLTGPLTLCYIVPVMAVAASGKIELQATDSILPLLAQQIMPIGLGGLFLAALIAASNSTASSVLNSLATLFETEMYRPLARGKSDAHYMNVGRVVTALGGVVGLVYAIECHRQGVGLLDAVWMIGSIFQPAIFVVTAGALFFRRATPAGGLACLFVGTGYALIGALGGWEWLSPKMDVLLLREFLSWDHTEAATRALVGMPLSAATLIAVSFFTKPLPGQEQGGMFDRIHFKPGGWNRPRACGATIAALGLVGMFVCAFVDRDLPKPWNVLIYLGLLSGFVGGMLLCADAFLPAEETEEHVPAAIEKSFLARYLGTGRAWAIVYALAAVIVIVLYLWG